MADTSQDRRGHTRALVKELLDERQQMWSLYCALGSMQPFSAEHSPDAQVQEFCQVLVDYISLGHFGIYQRLTDGTERRQKVLEVAEDIYPRIVAAADVAVEFNDKYESLSGDALRAHLADDLSRLGEELATRIELEDRLLEVMVA
jgi:regulator of sigma D